MLCIWQTGLRLVSRLNKALSAFMMYACLLSPARHTWRVHSCSAGIPENLLTGSSSTSQPGNQ
jgi:hypothetical protein